MARFAAAITNSVATNGAPSSTNVNGYIGGVLAATNYGFVLRRIFLGVYAGASVPTSQQMTVGLARSTTVPTGNITNTAGTNVELYTTASSITGLQVPTSTTYTGGLGTITQLHQFSFNTQSFLDIPAELLEQWQCLKGTGGLVLYNLTNNLPASHIWSLSAEWEE